ncbi:mitochondrial carrier protein rim2 [Colletotrichum truncatum]|uniref:Mitochondrial carrier protein rim2 n=1 Tax=Colletotrichum truncatum TaxID=5467 RepID=A0ACC3Z1B9_COLTU|nr:mitochondrial carrier protein rim2 [Colletotrichum truncatum]KAF6788962.1 mitochondrial carrier protein rim2 [Colletotrichum truncatum]
MAHSPISAEFMAGTDNRPASRRAPDTTSYPTSRETGDVIPNTKQNPAVSAKESPFAKSWVHFVAGGVGGMTAATLTAPLDVLKTRLQSDFYQAQLRASHQARAQAVGALSPLRAAAFHLKETFQILGSVYKIEGPRALFKGLGPNLIGVIPARSINFYTYGTGKRLIAEYGNGGQEAAWVHLSAGVLAGITTSTATNPIWLVKTRLQLDKNVAEQSGGVTKRQYRNSLDCIRQVLRTEGFTGLYKGMSASYLGVAESTLQWVLYEQIKKELAHREERIIRSGREKTFWDRTVDWMGNAGAAGGAKLVAAVLAYPHEVARTRLRQAPMANGQLKYTGLFQCFRLVWVEEGLMGLYGGLTPHLMRTVPSAAIMFGMYEGILRLFSTPAKTGTSL